MAHRLLPFTTNKTVTASIKQMLPSAEPAKMQMVTQPLDASYLTSPPASVATTTGTTAATSGSLHLIGSDAQGQRLEAIIPLGALDLSQATTATGVAPQGALKITWTQLHGHFAGATNELGSFQLQITDSQSQTLQHIQLHTPITFIYHCEATGATTLATQFFLTDDLGSVVSTFNAIAGSAVILGNQAYGPYGNQQYHQGSMGTAKGYTGQYADATGLDYYNARYYDPVSASFLSADTIEGNPQGLDPYSYVQGNPETATDPSGQRVDFGSGEQAIINFKTGAVSVYENNTNWTPDQVTTQVQGYIATGNTAYLARLTNPRQTPVIKVTPKARIVVEHFKTGTPYNPFTDKANSTAAKILQHTGVTDLKQTLSNSHASIVDKAKAVGKFVLRNVDNAMKVQMILDPLTALGIGGEKVAAEEAGSQVARACGGLSFTPDTQVSTDQGEQAIGTLKTGEKVWSYNPKTQKMELQPIEHVWINHDDDLIDLTLSTPAHIEHGKHIEASSEIVHTNKKHPFLTQEEGFVPVGELVPGIHIVRADGSVGVVSKWVVVPGTKTMYNLEVAQDHTFTVGDGQWIVHNAFCQVKDLNPIHSPGTSGSRPNLQKLSDQQLLEAVNNPSDGAYMKINTATGRLMDGNGRAYELQSRAASPSSSISPETRVYYEPYTTPSIPEPWEQAGNDFFNLFSDLE